MKRGEAKIKRIFIRNHYFGGNFVAQKMHILETSMGCRSKKCNSFFTELIHPKRASLKYNILSRIFISFPIKVNKFLLNF